MFNISAKTISMVIEIIIFIIKILVTKTCNGGRISQVLTNFIQNISALNSKHLLVIN